MMEKKAQLGSPEVGGVSKHLQNDGLTSRLIWAFLGLSNLWCLGAEAGSWVFTVGGDGGGVGHRGAGRS